MGSNRQGKERKKVMNTRERKENHKRKYTWYIKAPEDTLNEMIGSFTLIQ